MLNPPGDIVEYVMEPRQTNDKELCRDNMTLEQAGYEICDEEIIPVISTDFGANCRVELSKICRCCLARKNDLQSIFDTNSCIPEMIMSLATVEISSLETSLPTNICMQCFLQVSRAVSYKQLIETADATLRQYIILHDAEPVHDVPVRNDIDKKLSSKLHKSLIRLEDKIVLSAEQNNCTDPVEVKSIVMQNETENNDSILHILQESEDTGQIFYDSNETFIENAEFEDSEFVIDSHSLSNCSEPLNNCDNDDQKGSLVEDLPIKSSKSQRKTKQKHLTSDNILSKEPTEWSCYICKKDFPSHRKLNRHKKIHENEKAFKCSTCQKGFHERADLKRHIVRHNRIDEETFSEFRLRCTDCHMGFNVERDLLIHRSVHSNKNGKFYCGECGKEFQTNVQLKRHVRIHYQEKPHKCSLCNKGFPEKGSLTRHFRRHTGEEREKKHLCNLCGKKYFDSHSLNVHTRTHTGEKPWSCNVCNKSFIDSRLLYSHSKVHSSLKPYECSYCDKRFTHQSTLTSHVRTHTGEKPYVCSVCGKSFIQSSNLSLHMRVHSGEKPFKCNMCHRTFASSSTLRMHNRIHTGEKPYSCSVCFKTFARHDMSAHMRTHTGEKPYSCTTCTKRFTTSGQLSQHLRTHTGEPFVCNICFKACSSSTYLKKHQKAHAVNKDLPKQDVATVINNEPESTHQPIAATIDDQNLLGIANTYLVHETHQPIVTIGTSGDKINEFHVNHDALLSSVNANDLIHIEGDHENSIQRLTIDPNGFLTVESSSNVMSTHVLDCDKHIIYQTDPNMLRVQQIHSNGHP